MNVTAGRTGQDAREHETPTRYTPAGRSGHTRRTTVMPRNVSQTCASHAHARRSNRTRLWTAPLIPLLGYVFLPGFASLPPATGPCSALERTGDIRAAVQAVVGSMHAMSWACRIRRSRLPTVARAAQRRSMHLPTRHHGAGHRLLHQPSCPHLLPPEGGVRLGGAGPQPAAGATLPPPVKAQCPWRGGRRCKTGRAMSTCWAPCLYPLPRMAVR